jgi:hypothetical protein
MKSSDLKELKKNKLAMILLNYDVTNFILFSSNFNLLKTLMITPRKTTQKVLNSSYTPFSTMASSKVSN